MPIAAEALASRPISGHFNFHSRPASTPPRNASPAPVVSTTFTLKAGTRTLVSMAEMAHPLAPAVMITASLP